MRRGGIRSIAAGLFGVVLGCGQGGAGSPARNDETADWDLISGDEFACPDPCTPASAAGRMALDFAFDGDDLIVTGYMGVARLTVATSTWSPEPFDEGAIEISSDTVFIKAPGLAWVTAFDRAGAQVGIINDTGVALANTLRLSPEGKPLAMGTLDSDAHEFVLTEPAMPPVAPIETPMPDWSGDPNKGFALDEQGMVWYDSRPADNVTSTVTILDPAAGTTKVVAYPTPPADANGNVFQSFIGGSALWGPVPGGGVLAERQTGRGADVVRLMPDGTATFVVHANGSVGTMLRVRIHDGYVYAAGYGLWRSKQKLF
jgi:hypothetical protein